MQKQCKGKHGCGQLKDLSEFGTFRHNIKSGLTTYVNSLCKVCDKKRARERTAARRADPEIRKKHNAYRREYYQRKKLGIKRTRQTYEEYKAKRRKYIQTEEYKAKKRKYDRERQQTEEYKVKKRKYQRELRQTEEYKVKKRKYDRERLQTDPNFRLLHNLRTRLWHALKGNSKSAHTVELLGISIKECRQHIEAQFLEGMSWENYGAWHVDHIVPCASFDLTDPQQQRQCFHYSNLQPLTAPENNNKSDNITPYAAQRKWTGERWVNTLAPWLVDLSI